MNRENKNKIINPPILGTASLWNACGFKKSLSNKEPEKKKIRIFYNEIRQKKNLLKKK